MRLFLALVCAFSCGAAYGLLGCGQALASSAPTRVQPGRGTWQEFDDQGYLEGIVRSLKGDFWVASGDGFEDLARFRPSGSDKIYAVGSWQPLELTSDGNANLWFTVAHTPKTIVMFAPSTRQIKSYPLSDEAYGGITLGGDGNIWFVEQMHIGKLTPEGELTEFPTPQTQGGSGLAWSPGGSIWYSVYRAQLREYILAAMNATTGSVVQYGVQTTSSALALAASGDAIWFFRTGPPEVLVRFNPTSTASLAYRTPAHMAPAPCPGALTVAPDGALWYAAQRLEGTGFEKHVVGGGFVRFDPRSATFTTYPSPNGYQWNCDLVAAGNHTIWGTSGGAVTVLDAE